jgi:hypothetical protein
VQALHLGEQHRQEPPRHDDVLGIALEVPAAEQVAVGDADKLAAIVAHDGLERRADVPRAVGGDALGE